MKRGGDGGVIPRAHGARAQFLETEQRDAAARPWDLDPPSPHGHFHADELLLVGEPTKPPLEPRLTLLVRLALQANPPRTFEPAAAARSIPAVLPSDAPPGQPVVPDALHRVHHAPRLDGFDARNELHAIEPVFVQLVGFPIRRGHHGDAPLPQLVHQTADDHGVRDVRDLELVQAQHSGLRRDALRVYRHGVLGVPCFPELVEGLVRVKHEGMEVLAAFLFAVRAGQGGVEEVHAEGFAAAGAPEEVDAAVGRVRGRLVLLPRGEQVGEPAPFLLGRLGFPLRLGGAPVHVPDQLGVKRIQGLQRSVLCLVPSQHALLGQPFVRDQGRVTGVDELGEDERDRADVLVRRILRRLGARGERARERRVRR